MRTKEREEHEHPTGFEYPHEYEHRDRQPQTDARVSRETAPKGEKHPENAEVGSRMRHEMRVVETGRKRL
mgnify:CR=1 FL=1